MKRISFLTMIFVLMACAPKKQSYGKWELIFNGKDLTGWQVKITDFDLNDNYNNTFRVEDRKLKVSYDAYEKFDDKFGHIFFNEKLSHYRFRVEYRFVGKQVDGAPDWAYKNSGIKFHSQPPNTIPKEQKLLVAIEAQLLGGNGTEARPTGNVCTAGSHIEMNGKLITEHCINSTSKTYHDDQWVMAEIEVRGNKKVIHRINGEVVLEYNNPQLDDTDPYSKSLLNQGLPLMLSEGYLALQAESHPIEFRNIELMRLKTPNVNSKN